MVIALFLFFSFVCVCERMTATTLIGRYIDAYILYVVNQELKCVAQGYINEDFQGLCLGYSPRSLGSFSALFLKKKNLCAFLLRFFVTQWVLVHIVIDHKSYNIYMYVYLRLGEATYMNALILLKRAFFTFSVILFVC